MIVNTASVAAEDGQIGQAAYSASKGGVLAMALPIARDLMNDGRPGQHHPSRRVQDADGRDDAAQRAGRAAARRCRSPSGSATAEEYARLACFMVENPYMNAAAVRLDGGIRMAPR